MIVEFLEEIADGRLESDLERLRELKEKLKTARREVKNLESRYSGCHQENRREELEKRLVSAEELVRSLDGEVEKTRESLEKTLSALWGCEVRLQRLNSRNADADFS